MMTAGAIASLIMLAASLVLGMRAMRGLGLSFERKAAMAVVWFLIIASMAFIAGRFGA